MKYFEDEAKDLLVEDLFSTRAREMADKLLKQRITRVQGRKYFAEVRALEARFKSEKHRLKSGDSPELAFERIKPYLGLLQAKAYYGQRKERNMQEFARFIEDCVKDVHTEKTFKAMVKYIEAVVAFFMPDAKEGR